MTRTWSPERAGSERPSALTTPAVTLPASPSGLPMATTSWPTRSADASPSRGRLEIAVLGDQHREVGERIAAANAKAKLPAVGEVEPAAVTAGDDVRRGDQVAVGAQRDRGATPERGTAAPAGSDLHCRHRRRERRGYLGERSRVGVEQLAVVARVSRHPDLRPAPSARR